MDVLAVTNCDHSETHSIMLSSPKSGYIYWPELSTLNG